MSQQEVFEVLEKTLFDFKQRRNSDMFIERVMLMYELKSLTNR